MPDADNGAVTDDRPAYRYAWEMRGRVAVDRAALAASLGLISVAWLPFAAVARADHVLGAALCCGVCAPFAWSLATSLDPPRVPAARAGRILGVVGSVLWVLALLVGLGYFLMIMALSLFPVDPA